MPSLRYSGPSPLYRELAELPALDSAQFLQSDPATTVVRANYVVRDLDNSWKHPVTKTFTLSTVRDSESVLSSTIAAYAPDVRGFAVSRSGKHHALLKEYIGGDIHTTRRVEIWSDLRLVAALNVSKEHGPFLADRVFQSISFSPSETAIVYSAEEANPDTSDDLCEDPYPKYQYNPHFGESYPDTRRPILVMVRWASPADASSISKAPPKDKWVTVISLPPSMSDNIFFGQAIFATEDRIFATGFEKTRDGRFLGIKWCLNRPSSIWELSTTTDAMSDDDSPASSDLYIAVAIEVPGRSCRSPRVFFGQDGKPKHLFWLSNPVGGVHSSSTSLHVRDLAGGSSDRVLVDSVSEAGPEGFPGLYTEFNILPSPFLYETAPLIVLQTIWGSSATIVSVNIETGDVTHERSRFGGSALEAWIVLATDGRSQMVCSQSSLTSPPKLVLLTFNHGKWVRRVLDSPVVSPQVQEALDDLALSVIPIPDRYPAETIVLQSKKAVDTKGPKPYCVTLPHGGPHSVYTTGFLLLATALAVDGYTVSMPNFTGTLGFGDKYIHKLVGQIGTLDIADCMGAVEELIKRGISGRERQLVFGGSHGGFITGNLIGRHPDAFRAAVMINPVTSLGEFTTSDLPDFPFAEIGLSYPPGACVTPEVYKKLYDASPIAYVGNVRTPVLLILGDSDLRVPPTQGKGYFHALKARGVPVELLTFANEGHDLEGVEATRVTFESIRDWFKAYTRL